MNGFAAMEEKERIIIESLIKDFELDISVEKFLELSKEFSMDEFVEEFE